jgi:4-carboxymuconolactone decarboxylase
MTMHKASLGGRLPLYERAELTPAQQELFDWQQTNAVPWAREAGFAADSPEGRLIGPFNPALLTPALSKAFFEFVLAEHENTSLSKRAREVIILTVGAAWGAPYELYAHRAVGRHEGLSEEQVATLVDGALPGDLSDTETVVHHVTRTLSAEHRLHEELYQQAEHVLGANGLMDAVVLIGIYHTVSAILNAFEVPAPGQAADGAADQPR